MRCFPFVAPEGYWKGDTKSRVTPYGATPGSGHTTVASCTTWLDLGLARPAISASPATRRVRARAHLASCSLYRSSLLARSIKSISSGVIPSLYRIETRPFLLAVKNTPVESITFIHVETSLPFNATNKVIRFFSYS